MKPKDYFDIEVPGDVEKDFEKEIIVSNDTESDYFYRIKVKAHVRIRKDNLTQVHRSIMHVYPRKSMIYPIQTGSGGTGGGWILLKFKKNHTKTTVFRALMTFLPLFICT